MFASLAAALLVAALVRVPLVMNARSHLDSDLAVDGLTLRDALHGHWRWHYPGTPAVGTASLALMLPIGLVRGATSETLGVAGVGIYLLVMAATFWLAWRAFGPKVAAWSLVPLAFASTGTIWLSGRITGGHLLAAAWHSAAFGMLYGCLLRGGTWRAALLGSWCGLGVWNDSMTLMTVAGIVSVACGAWLMNRLRKGRPGSAPPTLPSPLVGEGWGVGWTRPAMFVGVIAFILAFAAGLLPKFVGRWADPHDAYNETFAPLWKSDILVDHTRLLAFDCLPRLVIGHRLPGLQAEPGGMTPGGHALPTWAYVGLGLGLFLVAVPGLAWERRGVPDPSHGRWAVRWGLLASTVAVLVGFVLNRNIFNSDNYRYLALLLAPWAIGFGRLMEGLARRGQGGAVAAGLIAVAFAAGATLDLAEWYHRLGWIDDRGRPVARPLDDPVLDWLSAHPEVDSLYGDYWDVYRIAFLTGGRIKGVPSPYYPDRFPGLARSFPGGHPGFALIRPSPTGPAIRAEVSRGGGVPIDRAGDGMIWRWPASGR